MSHYIFRPAAATPGVTYRFETLAAVEVLTRRADPVTGALPQFEGPEGAASLHQQALNAAGQAVGDPTTITGFDPTPTTLVTDPSIPADIARDSELAAAVLAAKGLPIAPTGAVLPTRYVGRWAATGAPATGTFAVGDFGFDGAGNVQLCTVAGTPGTWVAAGSATYVQVVEHGATAGTARPAGAVRVYWRGTVAPTNAVQYDRWIDTTSSPYIESIYTGSAWVVLGTASFVLKAPTTNEAAGNKILDITHNDVLQGSAIGRTGMWAYTNVFSAQTDPIIGWGYNANRFGQQDLAGEPTMFWQIEGHWNNSGSHVIETYVQVTDTAGANAKRPFYLYHDRVTHQSTVSLRTAQLMVSYDQAGSAAALNMLQLDPNNLKVLAALTGSNCGLSVNAAASRSASLYLGSDGNQTAFSATGITQNMAAFSVNNSTVERLYKTTSGVAACYGGPDDNGAGLTVYNGTSFANNPALAVKAKSDQSGDVFTVCENGGTAHVKVTKATSSVKASLVVGNAALATSATDGFIYAPTVAGTPTGAPTGQTGTAPIVLDTTGSKLWAYIGGAWKSAALA